MAFAMQFTKVLMSKRFASFTLTAGVLIAMAMPGLAQEQQTTPTTDEDAAPKRIFGIIPNYRTTRNQTDYMPLSSGEKYRIAAKESFDPGTLVLSGLFAGESHLTKSTPSFGQGPSGYARYYAASYGDFVIGDFMTEAVFPSILHEDPRYFRRENGSALSRLGYAVQQIFWTRTDNGRGQFNFSEILGNSTSVAISNAYYPDNRTAGEAATRLSIQIGVDIAGNILKEFSPELNRLLSRRHTEKEAVK